MIFVTGDTHFPTDAGKLFKRSKGFPVYSLRKIDHVIVLGDFGLFWSRKDIRFAGNLRQIEDLPYTLLFIDGNHENFDLLEELPIIEKFGGRVQVCGKNVYHLMRGEIYEIQRKHFFVCGGAMSYDKEFRQPYVSWWPQEMLSTAEENYAWQNLERAERIDFILTHTCPDVIVNDMFGKTPTGNSVERFFSRVAERLPEVPWYFGHWHENKDWGRFHCRYDRILQIV